MRTNTVAEIDKAIAELNERKELMLKAAAKVPQNVSSLAEFFLMSHAGRIISEREELNGGYCGSVNLEAHLKQIADPDCWVHSSLERWVRKAAGGK